jgi:hypothetical protein
MMTCLIVAAIVSCTNPTPKPSPAEAIKVITASVPAFVPVNREYERARENARYQMMRQPIRDATTSMPVPTPTKPLSEPWRVTTVVTRDRGVQTWFNGERVR